MPHLRPSRAAIARSRTFAILLTVFATLLAAPQPAVASATTGAIQVTIWPEKDPGRLPAQVSIKSRSGVTLSTQTHSIARFGVVEPGWYTVYVQMFPGLRWAGSELRPDMSEAVYVSAGATSYAIVSFPEFGSVSGRVTTDPATPPGSRRWEVTAYAPDRFGRLTSVGSGSSSIHNDSFQILDVPAGEIYLRATPVDADYGLYDPSWGIGVTSWADAQPVVVEPQTMTRDIELRLPTRGPIDVERLGGEDRFDMAANVSRAAVSDSEVGDGVPVVFVANGLNFPDALSAGPVAAQYGPLLLTTPSSLPASTRAEIERLKPEQIVIVGGPNSVGRDVESELGALAAEVTRVSGPDRYEVSRALARLGFPDGSELAVLATGANFPDALAAGSYAGSMGAPVVLINGPTGTLDAATLTLLDELGVRSVLIVGGPNSVPLSVTTQLEAIRSIEIINRATGEDRYVAALEVPKFHAFSHRVFYANGAGFADALAGSWYAARLQAPIILAHFDCVPSEISPGTSVTVLGGPNSISNALLTGFPVC